jgi:hypothetical protein
LYVIITKSASITLVIATVFTLSALSGNTTTPLVYTVEYESNTEQGLLQKYPGSANSTNTNFGNNTIDGIAAAGYEDTPVNPIGTCEGCIVEFLSPSEIDTLAQRIAVIPGVVGICETLEIGIEQTQFRDVLIELNVSPGTADALIECLLGAGIRFVGH